jgi:LmbE family N-acetylglucosaminyl deacetylase
MPEPVRVSCIIPAYNEAATIGDVVAAARACAGIDEIIVISDGGTDPTADRAEEAGATCVVTLPHNEGKSDAVLAGLRCARGDVIVLLDADLIGVRPQHLDRLLRPVLAGRADMTVASFIDDPWHKLLQPLSGQRCFRRALLHVPEMLRGTGFGLEVVLDRMARDHHARVAQVVWRSIRHRSKREKYGTVDGLRLKVRASSDLLRQARPPIRSPRPRDMEGRSPRMIVLMVLLVALIAASVPVFIVHPSHASTISLPALPVPSRGDRLLVIVAHPDDEVIGAGGLIAAAVRRGAAVSVIVVTNGDSNRMSAAVLSRKVRPRAAQLIEEGRIRQQETLRALARLGVPPGEVFFLGFPDRLLTQVLRSDAAVTSPFTRVDRVVYQGVVAPGAPYTRQALISLTEEIVARRAPTAIVTHASFDRHGDHQAVAALVGTVRGGRPVYAFLVHAPGYPRPLRLSPRDPLAPPQTDAVRPGPWTWARLDLSPEIEAMKLDAVRAYRSQLVTPYLRLLLPSFVRTNELYAVRTP